jgi:hypothetical protein
MGNLRNTFKHFYAEQLRADTGFSSLTPGFTLQVTFTADEVTLEQDLLRASSVFLATHHSAVALYMSTTVP